MRQFKLIKVRVSPYAKSAIVCGGCQQSSNGCTGSGHSGGK